MDIGGKMSDRLDQLWGWRSATAKELHDITKPTVIKGPFGDLTIREFIVTLHEENTEYMAALEMLAEIHRWFYVEPKETADD